LTSRACSSLNRNLRTCALLGISATVAYLPPPLSWPAASTCMLAGWRKVVPMCRLALEGPVLVLPEVTAAETKMEAARKGSWNSRYFLSLAGILMPSVRASTAPAQFANITRKYRRKAAFHGLAGRCLSWGWSSLHSVRRRRFSIRNCPRGAYARCADSQAACGGWLRPQGCGATQL
jgi:hypothetical protein